MAKRGPKPEPLAKKFADNTERQNDCLVWIGSRSKKTNYGWIYHDGRKQLAHRVAFDLVHRENPALNTEVIRHTCDNPPCVLASHLLRGTHADNVRDKMERGRHGCAPPKITDAQVLELHDLVDSGVSYKEIAQHFGLSYGTVQYIATGKRRERLARPRKKLSHKLDSKKVEQIRAMVHAGQSQKSVAALFGICAPQVSRIVNKRRWL